MMIPLLPFLLAVSASAAPAPKAPTVAEAPKFMDESEETLHVLGVRSAMSSWMQQTDINYTTEWLAADADNAYSAKAAELAHQASRFDKLKLPPDLARKFLHLKLAVDSPAPP